MAEKQKCWRELLLTKFTFEVREGRSDMKLRLWLFNLLSKIWDGSISASDYEDTSLDRQERAEISKENILNVPFFITTHSLIIIKRLRTNCWEYTLHVSSDSLWVLFLSFICIWEVRFKQWLSQFQHLRWMSQSLCLTAFALSLSLGCSILHKHSLQQNSKLEFLNENNIESP